MKMPRKTYAVSVILIAKNAVEISLTAHNAIQVLIESCP